jgi:Na+/proline symporter
MVVHLLPSNIGFFDALHVGGKAGKLNVITTGIQEHKFNWKDQYNLASGLIGGFFLALSYFGTDQSQVGRYLTARSVGESRLGLLMNGLVKVPMQFLILLVGVLVFSFYQFAHEPLFFNDTQLELLSHSKYKDSLTLLTREYDQMQSAKVKNMNLLASDEGGLNQTESVIKQTEEKKLQYRNTIKRWLKDKSVGGDGNDTNYIFLRFVVDYLPKGLVGLLIAVIFLAAWGSIAASLNSLASCTIVDFHKQFAKKTISEKREYSLSQRYTLLWGIFCIIVAQLAYNIGNSLIEAVNVLGSLFYGVILGIFLVAFYMKKIGATAVFISAIIVELMVILIYVLNQKGIIGLSFLWLNVVGAIGVILLSRLLNQFFRKKNEPATVAVE